MVDFAQYNRSKWSVERIKCSVNFQSKSAISWKFVSPVYQNNKIGHLFVL